LPARSASDGAGKNHLILYTLAGKGVLLLKKYQQGWATEDIMVTMCRNVQNYQSKKKRGYFKKKGKPVDSSEESNEKSGTTEGGDEGEAADNGEQVVETSGDDNKSGEEEKNMKDSESESDVNTSGSDEEMEGDKDDGVDEEAWKIAHRVLKRRYEDDQVIVRKMGREKQRKS
jgi:hypothetical protein